MNRRKDSLRVFRRLAEGRENALKGYLRGCHRAVPPATTVARIRPFMPAMGITRVGDVTGLDRIGIPVVMVSRPNSRSVAVSQGKGLDQDAAVASGLMEAVEGFHAEHIELSMLFASHAEISRGRRVVDVDRMPRVAGDRYSPHLRMLWVEGWELLSEAPCWVPYESVSANFTLPLPPGSGCFDASTNGLASGNHVLEALCHGVCEVVERDATALWHRNPSHAQARTRVDPESVDDEACQSVIAQVRRAQFELAIWETTSDTRVPSFLSVITDQSDHTGHLGMGMGAHPSRAIALLRALTEAVQVRTTYISGARDDLELEEYDTDGRRRKLGPMAKIMASGGEQKDFCRVPDFATESFSADLEGLLSRLRDVGIDEVVAVDLSREEFDIPVVRVCIPGLEGADDHDGYLPGARAKRAMAGRS